MQLERARLLAKELQLAQSSVGDPVVFHGNSMLPFLQDGDALGVEPVSWKDIEIGDILTYRLEDKFPTLRVVRKTERKAVLIGDNWPKRRFEVWPENVLGKVMSRTRAGVTLTADSLRWRLYSRFVVLRYKLGSKLAIVKRKGLKPYLHAVVNPRREEPYQHPPNIQVNVSAQCNLTCRMCPYLSVHQDSSHLRFMTRETLMRLVPLIKRIGAVHFSGSGEPLFNPQLFEFIALVRQAAPATTIDLTTNGTLLTEKRARQLIELGVSKVHVSFDGLPGTVEAIRLGIKGSQVIDNIRRLTELKTELKSRSPIVQINYMTGYGTYAELGEFVKLGCGIGVSEIQLLEMQPATASDAAENLFHGVEHDNGQALKTAIMLAQHAGMTLHLPRVTENACYYPYNPHIGEDGEVYPCCYLDYDGRQLYHDGQEVRLPSVSFGNITTHAFAKIWSSPAYAEFRRKNTKGDFNPHCRACYEVRRMTARRVEALVES